MFIKSNFRRPKSSARYEVSQTVQDASLSVKDVATMALNGTLDFSLITPRLDNTAPVDDLDDTDVIDYVPEFGQDLAEMSETATYLRNLQNDAAASSNSAGKESETLQSDAAAPSNFAGKQSATLQSDAAAPSNSAGNQSNL